MIDWKLKASLEMRWSPMSYMKLETLMEEIPQHEGDQQLARETIFTMVQDVRALLGSIEALYVLDQAMLATHPGMAPEVIKQRNALLAIPRKLCRAEVMERWVALDGRWAAFAAALDTTSK